MLQNLLSLEMPFLHIEISGEIYLTQGIFSLLGEINLNERKKKW